MSKKLSIIASVIIFSIAMTLIDAFVHPNYFVKIPIKILFFLALPFLFFIKNREVFADFKRLFVFKRGKILTSLLLGIGMSMIFKGFHFSFKVKKNTLGDSVKYIDSSSLKNVTIRNKLGATEIRFENVCTYEGGGTLTVHNTLGQSTVYVPSGWTVKFKTVNTLGEINVDPSISASSANSSPDAPVIHINLYNKLGEIDVRPM